MTVTPEMKRRLVLDDVAEFLEKEAKRFSGGKIAPVYKAMADEIREAMKQHRRVNL